MVATQMVSQAVTARTAVVRGSLQSTNPSFARPAIIQRVRRTVVRAEESPVEPAPEMPSVAPPTPAPIPAPVTTSARPGIGEAMAFSGAPEIINGRLAMLAFVAALGAELATGKPVLTQLGSAPVLVIATAVLFSWASLVPWLKGDKDTKGVGPFTPSAEMLNGRAAMLGFAALLAIEGVKHTALF